MSIFYRIQTTARYQIPISHRQIVTAHQLQQQIKPQQQPQQLQQQQTIQQTIANLNARDNGGK